MTSDGGSEKVTQPMRLTAALLWLALAFLLMTPLAALGFYQWHGELGLLAALVAAGICWLAGVLALIVTALYTWLGNPVAAVLGSMLIRMGFPLGTCLVGATAAPQWMEAGFPLACAGFYFYVVIVETGLSLRVAAVNTESKGAES